MRLIIDGDGSPVKNEVIEVSQAFRLPVLIVTSINHFTNHIYPENVELVYVDSGAEMADYRIIAVVNKGDIVVTQDYGLASLVLNKAFVLHQSGKEYTSTNIDLLLSQRAASKQMRKAGKRTKGPKAFTNENREIFRQALISLIERELTK